jgi:DNA-binding CsgD family transcriptional regulator
VGHVGVTRRPGSVEGPSSWIVARYRSLIGTPLTDLEEKIMRALSAGQTAAEVGDALGYAKGTINAHTAVIRARLNARTMEQAMHLWTMTQPRAYRLLRLVHGDCE